MRKPTFLIMLIALLIAVAGIWGALNVRAHLPNQKNSAHVSTLLYTPGTRVIPTVKVSTNCDPKRIPGAAPDAAGGIGSPAIKPHLCGIPTFTEEDVRQYMSTVSSFTGHRIGQTSAHFTVNRILFVTNQVANDILNCHLSNIMAVFCQITCQRLA